MKLKLLSSCIALLLFISCSQKVTKKDLTHLSGFWEIEKVIFTDGETKTYDINPIVDHYQLFENSTGIKKKGIPKFDGTFKTSGNQDHFKIVYTETIITIAFNNALSNRIEEIVSLSESQLTLKNEEGVLYYYKRFTPINIAE